MRLLQLPELRVEVVLGFILGLGELGPVVRQDLVGEAEPLSRHQGSLAWGRAANRRERMGAHDICLGYLPFRYTPAKTLLLACQWNLRRR